MEVDRVSFAPRLLEILEDMAKCTFMAIDFEFSGVASRRTHAPGRQTVQERYWETKEAAERYHILQVGLTFAIYDDDTNRYVLKPYNMNLNPLIEERLDIERILTFQSGALEFLLRHGLNLHENFKRGVPYLTRDEAAKAKTTAYERLLRKNISDIPISSDDVEALAFMEGLRKTIGEWKETGDDELDISSRYEVCQMASDGATSKSTEPSSTRRPGLSRFEKRLVHQLVRTEYPDLVTTSGWDSIRIIHLDEEREAELLRRRKYGVKHQINRQTGFRWIVEAMLGNSLHRIDARSFSLDPETGVARFTDLGALQSRFDHACISLQRRRVPLIGHNMFTDLVYFYGTFIGELPEAVDDFAAQVHQLFPTIVDTKYLATHNCGDINPASSLQEIEEKVRPQQKPTTVTHVNHDKYIIANSLHEAGCDSYLTALVAVRLSAQLENEGSYIKEAQLVSEDTEKPTSATSGVIESATDAVASLRAPTSHDSSTVAPSSEQLQPDASAHGRFATTNAFEHLDTLSIDDRIYSDATAPNHATEWAVLEGQVEQEPLPPMTKMPAFGSDFWKVYGNKLRLFGTVDGVLDLTKGDSTRASTPSLQQYDLMHF